MRSITSCEYANIVLIISIIIIIIVIMSHESHSAFCVYGIVVLMSIIIVIMSWGSNCDKLPEPLMPTTMNIFPLSFPTLFVGIAPNLFCASFTCDRACPFAHNPRDLDFSVMSQ